MSRGPDLSIICPTILGREGALAATMSAFKQHTPGGAEVIVPQGHPTVGSAWNEGARRATGDLLLFTIDDAIPHPGWFDAATSALDADVIPSPTLWFADGTLEAAGTMGAGCLLPLGRDGIECRSGGIILCSRRQFRNVGDFLPIHYYTDDDWHWRFHQQGCRTVVCHGFAFTHGHHPKGREEMQRRSMADRQAWLRNVAGAGPEEKPLEAAPPLLAATAERPGPPPFAGLGAADTTGGTP